MIDRRTRGRGVRVRILQENFHSSINEVVTRQHVDSDMHAVHYAANLLTIFSRSDEFREERAEYYGLRPLALMLTGALIRQSDVKPIRGPVSRRH